MDRWMTYGGRGSPNEKEQFAGWGIGQHNVTYRKNVAVRCGCSVTAAE